MQPSLILPGESLPAQLSAFLCGTCQIYTVTTCEHVSPFLVDRARSSFLVVSPRALNSLPHGYVLAARPSVLLKKILVSDEFFFLFLNFLSYFPFFVCVTPVHADALVWL